MVEPSQITVQNFNSSFIPEENNVYEDRVPPFTAEMGHHSPNLGTSSGISRQQLINR